MTSEGKTGRGDTYLKGAIGEDDEAAARTDTYLGERYRRIVKRRGRLKALVAVARSILVIIWQLLADPAARFGDFGPDYHSNKAVIERRLRNHIAQLTAMGYRVTLNPPPRPPNTHQRNHTRLRSSAGSLSPAHSPWVILRVGHVPRSPCHLRPLPRPPVGHLNGANLSSTRTPAGHAPGVGNYVTAGGELRDGQPLKPGELRDR